MDNSLHETLLWYWMSEIESKLYLAVLKVGHAWSSSIGRLAWVKRITAYATLQDMVIKWYVKSIDKQWTTVFYAVQPNTLLGTLQSRIDMFKEALPWFDEMVNEWSIIPTIEYFQWRKQMEQYFWKILEQEETIYSFLWRQDMDKELETYLIQNFIPKRVEKNISAKTIVCDADANKSYTELDKQFLRETKIISHPWFTMGDEIDFCAPDTVWIFLHWKDEMSAMIIKSERVYTMMKSLFDFVRDVW